MNKIQLLIAVLLIILLGGIFYFVQAANKSKEPTPLTGVVPTLIPATPASAISNIPTSAFPTPTASVADPTIPAATTNEKVSEATIKTSKGTIMVTLYPDEAPNTVKNFAMKAASGYYKGLTFHRVEDWVLQGGDPLGNGTGGGKMKTELNDKPFVTGSLGVARGGDINISNDSQFFFTKSDASWLNNQYTNFGIVTEGMDVVNKMAIGDKILEITVK